MNLSCLSGLAYLALLVLVPAGWLLLVWRRSGPASVAFRWALLAVPVFAFVFGGAWFAVPDWLFRGPNPPPTAMRPWGVFLLTGLLSTFYAAGGLAAVGALLSLWRFAHPTSFNRLTRRVQRTGVARPATPGGK
ncbi:MAG TPA: hypothetical protein VKD90_01405 [Gemmataceae bacterium]|nr:hypothetical protein [Gemmataceae bacterium]